MPERLDFNLLLALDALLEEGSVSGAAVRLGLSQPALSRTLARLRERLGDPVLVRSGRDMVPTARAQQLRGEVHVLVNRVRDVLSTSDVFDPGRLDRPFTIIANDAMVTSVGHELVLRVRSLAPGVVLRFLAEPPDDHQALREGLADLEIGMVGPLPSEMISETLAEDRIVAIVQPDHPLASTPDLDTYLAAEHITASRRGIAEGPIDDLLVERGTPRRIVACAPTFAAMTLMVARSGLVGHVPRDQYRGNTDRLGLTQVPLPFPVPPFPLLQVWHPRNDGDPAHRWLRGVLRECAHECLPHRP